MATVEAQARRNPAWALMLYLVHKAKPRLDPDGYIEKVPGTRAFVVLLDTPQGKVRVTAEPVEV
jgi:hypothetical protein